MKPGLESLGGEPGGLAQKFRHPEPLGGQVYGLGRRAKISTLLGKRRRRFPGTDASVTS